jgi:hypothetical protein
LFVCLRRSPRTDDYTETYIFDIHQNYSKCLTIYLHSSTPGYCNSDYG